MYYRMQVLCTCILTLFCLELGAQSHREILRDATTSNFDSLEQLILDNIDMDDPGNRTAHKHYMRWKMLNESRLNEEGRLVNAPALNRMALANFVQPALPETNQRATNGAWIEVSPDDFATGSGEPANGRLNCITVHPTDPNKIYVGAAIGGMWMTEDGGNTWQPLTDGLTDLGISAIAIDHQNPDNMYILTGDGDGEDVPSVGILKSTNGGVDWEETSWTTSRSSTMYGNRLIMHPDSPMVMLASIGNKTYKTVDGWESKDWSAGVRFQDLDYMPGGPDTIFACRTDHRVFKSTDGGVNWTYLNELDIGLPMDPDTAFHRSAIAISPTSPNHVYALFARNTGEGTWGYHEIYYSDDYGHTFSLMSAEYDMISDQCTYNLDMVVSPIYADHVYVGAVNLWKSEDNGQSFTRIANGENLPSVHADIHHMVWDGFTFYTASDGGISQSLDLGVSFTNITPGINIMQFKDIDVLGIDVMGGTQDNGTNRWDIGDAIGNRIAGGDGFEVIYDPTEDPIYCCTQNDRFRYTSAQGWIDITPPGHDKMWDASWIKHPTDHDTMYCAFKNLAITYDRGDSWTIIDSLFTSDKTIRAMAQGIDNPERLYLSDRFDLKRTTSLHAATPNWLDITGNWPGSLQVGGIAVDPDDMDRVWITFHGYSSANKVMFSETGGFGTDPWVNITDNLPNVPVLCVAYEPGSNDGIYIGTDIGVFYRNANMPEWIHFSNNLPQTRIDDLVIRDGFLYAGTYGRGMWRTTLYSACPPQIFLTQGNAANTGSNIGTQVFSASDIIVSSRILDGGIGTNVSYSAGNSIVLSPGFHAKQLVNMKANLDGCPD